MYKEDLALNNQQWVVCHKTQPNQIPYIYLSNISTTPGQSVPGSDGDEGVLCIHQSSRITGTSPSDCYK